ncbi:MAG: hypothetical protein JXC85_03050 [Candidatus Aenigmarchaeota archaeon]|nr:hypothetical protein [Candidatus Aenigmarchaeota archaeon]
MVKDTKPIGSDIGFRRSCYALCIALAVYSGLSICDWKRKNDTYEVSGTIKSAEDFRMRNDAHFPIHGKDVVLVPDDDPNSEIEFPISDNKWDDTAKVGDRATFELYPGIFTGSIHCSGMDDGK